MSNDWAKLQHQEFPTNFEFVNLDTKYGHRSSINQNVQKSFSEVKNDKPKTSDVLFDFQQIVLRDIVCFDVFSSLQNKAWH